MHKAARIDAAAVSARPHQEEFNARNEHRCGCCREDGIERALHPSHINSKKVVRRFVRTALQQFSHARDPKSWTMVAECSSTSLVLLTPAIMSSLLAEWTLQPSCQTWIGRRCCNSTARPTSDGHRIVASREPARITCGSPEPRRRIPGMEQRGFPEEVRAALLSPGSAGRSPVRCLKSARWLARSGPDSERSPQVSKDRSRHPEACRRGGRQAPNRRKRPASSGPVGRDEPPGLETGGGAWEPSGKSSAPRRPKPRPPRTKRP